MYDDNRKMKEIGSLETMRCSQKMKIEIKYKIVFYTRKNNKKRLTNKITLLKIILIFKIYP